MNKKAAAKFTRKAAKRKSRLAIGPVPSRKVITPKTKRAPKYPIAPWVSYQGEWE